MILTKEGAIEVPTLEGILDYFFDNRHLGEQLFLVKDVSTYYIATREIVPNRIGDVIFKRVDL